MYHYNYKFYKIYRFCINILYAIIFIIYYFILLCFFPNKFDKEYHFILKRFKQFRSRNIDHYDKYAFEDIKTYIYRVRYRFFILRKYRQIRQITRQIRQLFKY